MLSCMFLVLILTCLVAGLPPWPVWNWVVIVIAGFAGALLEIADN